MAYGQSDLNEQHRFIPRIRFADGGNVNLSVLRDALQEQCDSNGIPVAFQDDTLKTGSFFNPQSEDVLILYHPDHSTDYLRFMLRVTYQGKYAFLDVFKVGGSKNFARDNKASRSTGQMLFNMLSGHATKLQEEENYYTILEDCFQNILV